MAMTYTYTGVIDTISKIEITDYDITIVFENLGKYTVARYVEGFEALEKMQVGDRVHVGTNGRNVGWIRPIIYDKIVEIDNSTGNVQFENLGKCSIPYTERVRYAPGDIVDVVLISDYGDYSISIIGKFQSIDKDEEKKGDEPEI